MTARGASSRGTNIACGMYGVDLVTVLFELDPTSKSTFEDVAQLHASQIAGVEVKQTNTKASDVSDKNTTCNLTFGENQQNNAGKILLTQHGFIENTIVEAKKVKDANTENEKQFMIQYVNDDGSVGLNSIKIDGDVDDSEVIILTLDEIFKQYRPSKSRIELFKGYPDSTAAVNAKGWRDNVVRACVTVGLQNIVMDPEFANFASKLRVQKKPSPKVCVNTDVDKGTLRIVPLTVKFLIEPKKKNDNCVHAKVRTWPAYRIPEVIHRSSSHRK